MDNKKIPIVIALVVIAVAALLWSLKGSFGIGEAPPPHGPPPGAMEQYKAQTGQK